MSLHLTAMTAADIPAVAAIEAQQHLTPWLESGFKDALRHGWSTCVLRDGAQTENQVLGYFVAMTVGDDEELLTITVAPEYAGRGYGRLLLETLLREARARGAQRLFLEVRQSNTPAIHLYESAGFTMAGMRKNYYAIPADPSRGRAAGREDAVLMVNVLQAGAS